MPIVISAPTSANWGDLITVTAVTGSFTPASELQLRTITPGGASGVLTTKFDPARPNELFAELPPVPPPGFTAQAGGGYACHLVAVDGLVSSQPWLIAIGLVPGAPAVIDVQRIAEGLRVRVDPVCAAGGVVRAELVSTASVPGAKVVGIGDVPIRPDGMFTDMSSDVVVVEWAKFKEFLSRLTPAAQEILATLLPAAVGTSFSMPARELLNALAKVVAAGEGGQGLADVGQMLYDMNIPVVPEPPRGTVQADVTWVVRDKQHRDLRSGKVANARTQGYQALDPVTLAEPAPTADLLRSTASVAAVLAPVNVVELTAGLDVDPAKLVAQGLGTTYYVAVRVVVTAFGESSAPHEIEVPVVCAPLPIPTVALLFIDRDFNGRLLMWVPASSPVATFQAGVTALSTLAKTVDRLKWVAGIAELLAGIDVLTRVPNPTFVFHTADAIDDFDGLDDFHALIGKKFLGVGPDDECSSIVLVAAPTCPHSSITVYGGEDRAAGGSVGITLWTHFPGVALAPDLSELDAPGASVFLPYGDYAWTIDRGALPKFIEGAFGVNDAISSAEFAPGRP